MYLTAKEAAEEIGVTHHHVRFLCRKYDIGKWIGKRRVLTKDHLSKLKKIRKENRVGRPRKAK